VVHIDDHYVVVVGGRQAIVAWEQRVAERIAAAITARLCDDRPDASHGTRLPLQ